MLSFKPVRRFRWFRLLVVLIPLALAGCGRGSGTPPAFSSSSSSSSSSGSGSSSSSGSSGATLFNGATALTWSIRMADSQIARTPVVSTPPLRPAWNYETGFFIWSLFDLDHLVTTSTYRNYATSVISQLISSTGVITGYPSSSATPYNIDDIMAGRNLLELHQRTGEARYRTAANTLRNQLSTHPRNSLGGFYHKNTYPNQMWLDGLYMGEPFYCRYGLLYGEPAIYDDVALQFRLIDLHTYAATAQLWYHAWDESKLAAWADPTTGCSSIFWGRGMGWYGMALVDVLDYLPLNHPRRPELLEVLQRFAAGVVRYQGATTGVWYQVVDQGTRAGNYLEASASCMFTYVLAKGINNGYLSSATYRTAAIRGYAGIINQFVTGTGTTYNLNSIRSGLGVSVTYGQYVNAATGQIISNDHKGVAAFILASNEIQILVSTQ